MKKLMMFVFSALVVAAVSSPAHAGFYVGGSLGQATTDGAGTDISDGSTFTGTNFDDEDTGYKVYGGFSMFKVFALEASWSDIGAVSTSAMSDGSGLIYAPGQVSGSIDTSGYSVAAVGRLPVGPVTLFGRVGYMFWEADQTLSNSALPGGSISQTADGSDELYGGGLVWDYPGFGALRFEYESVSFDEIDMNTISTGVVFSF